MPAVNDEPGGSAYNCAMPQDFGRPAEPEVQDTETKAGGREEQTRLVSLTLQSPISTPNRLQLGASSPAEQWLHCKCIVKGLSRRGSRLRASGKHQAPPSADCGAGTPGLLRMRDVVTLHRRPLRRVQHAALLVRLKGRRLDSTHDKTDDWMLLLL